MSTEPGMLDRLIAAVLYEGYILYPYRASACKNRQRFTFGRVYPGAFSEARGGAEPSTMHSECLVRPAADNWSVEVELRFLHPMARNVGLLAGIPMQWSDDLVPEFAIVPELTVDDCLYQTWLEAVEQRVSTTATTSGRVEFACPSVREFEPIRNRRGEVIAVLERQRAALHGVVETSTERIPDSDLVRIRVVVGNRSELPAEAAAASSTEDDGVLLRTFASTHLVWRARGAAFVSLTNPPPEAATAAGTCRNRGAWPVLVGAADGPHDLLLSSPIVLPDFPEVAGKSAGDLFDATEIDEILSLRILTMTDAEKHEMRHVDARARRLLERTEELTPHDFARMHGVMRRPTIPADRVEPGDRFPGLPEDFHLRPASAALPDGTTIRAGDHVRIRPKVRADAMDLVLANREAIVDALEADAEGRVHAALVLPDDPGLDLGMLRQPGHRFFYTIDQLEAWPVGSAPPPGTPRR